MVIIANVVAPEIALMVADQRLEVEIGQLVHDVEHDILEELVIELRSPRHHLQVATVLRQASVHHGVVLVVRVHDRVLQPLVVSIAHEALTVGKLRGAVHLSMAAKVRSEAFLLAHCVLHKAATVVHLAVDRLTAHPLISSEGRLINVHDLVPSAHEVFLLELLGQWLNQVANDILLADRAIVD